MLSLLLKIQLLKTQPSPLVFACWQGVKEVLQSEDGSASRNKEVKELKDTYCIVLASQVKRSNAEEYVSQLQKRGISDARINVEKGTIRVICGKYDNQSQAYNHLNKMAMNIEFADAWVYKLKEV